MLPGYIYGMLNSQFAFTSFWPPPQTTLFTSMSNSL
uniref:Uncharacterized protein n=1 Tax=Anguilla anguilla TaxID=7936 RepID=A0A0E9U5S7_ANGAN